MNHEYILSLVAHRNGTGEILIHIILQQHALRSESRAEWSTDTPVKYTQCVSFGQMEHP